MNIHIRRSVYYVFWQVKGRNNQDVVCPGPHRPLEERGNFYPSKRISYQFCHGVCPLPSTTAAP